jgi:hypothetical protein
MTPKRLRAASCALSTAAVLLLGLLVATGGDKIELSKGDVQAAVSKVMPLTGERVGFRYTIENAVVDLREDGRVGVHASVTGSVASREAKADVSAAGRLLFRNGALYVTDLQVEDVGVPSLALKEGDGAAKAALSKLGVLHGTDGRLGLPDAVSAALRGKMKDAASFAVGAALKNHPVYDTAKKDDWKHHLARMALGGVTVRGDTLIVSLSPTLSMLRVGLWGLAAGLGLAAAAGFAAARKAARPE